MIWLFLGLRDSHLRLKLVYGKTLKLPVVPGIGAQVGDFYAGFIVSLVNWLCGKA